MPCDAILAQGISQKIETFTESTRPFTRTANASTSLNPTTPISTSHSSNILSTAGHFTEQFTTFLSLTSIIWNIP
ncbi:hypothetical protein VTL71DRAFT_8356 [Oculimacula yallundae]|uniref:Uncharacterized protein n=1 Tax=Oculimacula yallundae TaxID=86028 RepID=A0ABR4CXM3_9HELO